MIPTCDNQHNSRESMSSLAAAELGIALMPLFQPRLTPSSDLNCCLEYEVWMGRKNFSLFFF